MKFHKGSCLCGQVHFRILAEPGASRICWCSDCQKLAANGTVNAVFSSDAIEVMGALAQHTKTADSGNQVMRRFCAQCGTQVFSDSTGRPGLTVVRVGTLDEPSAVTPTANIWTASVPDWACINGALEQFEGAPPAVPAQPR